MRRNLAREESKPKIHPILKWAGGKRWFVENHRRFLPDNYKRYIEPFAGSAAVFFYCQPETAILADSNLELINTYEAVKTDWRRVVSKLRFHDRLHSDDYYYDVRASKPRNIFTKAAKFIYLNRTCWNGLYRVNKQGQFNVPRGTKKSAILPTDDFEAVHDLLQNTELRCSDFKQTITDAGDGDFLFVDPPYTVRHNHNGFVKYNETLFSWEDQEDLCTAVRDAKSRGANLLMTNANHPSIRDLYGSGFQVEVLNRYSAISSLASSRTNYEELIIS